MLPADYFKCMSMCTKKVTDKVDAPILVNAVSTALCPSISELRGRHSQQQMAPRFNRSPNISKCQVSDCQSIDENKDNEKNYQTDKRSLFTIRLYTWSKM